MPTHRRLLYNKKSVTFRPSFVVISGLRLQGCHTGLPRVCQVSLWPLHIHISNFQLLPVTHLLRPALNVFNHLASSPKGHGPTIRSLSPRHTVCPFCFSAAPRSLCLPEGIQDLVEATAPGSLG